MEVGNILKNNHTYACKGNTSLAFEWAKNIIDRFNVLIASNNFFFIEFEEKTE